MKKIKCLLQILEIFILLKNEAKIVSTYVQTSIRYNVRDIASDFRDIRAQGEMSVDSPPAA